jgi:cytidylate kinase
MEGHVASWLRGVAEPGRAERRTRVRPFVTISRQSGAYGVTTGTRLVEHLRARERRRHVEWAVLDRELVRKVIEDHRLPAIFERYFAEATRSRVQDALDDIFGVHPPQETLVRQMSETVLRLASMGYVILVGQGAGIVTRGLPGGTRVRLIGSPAKRVAHIKEYLKLSEQEALNYVANEDRERSDYIRRYFKADVNDPSLYDVVINTDTVSQEQIVAMIGDMIFRQQSGPG